VSKVDKPERSNRKQKSVVSCCAVISQAVFHLAARGRDHKRISTSTDSRFRHDQHTEFDFGESVVWS